MKKFNFQENLGKLFEKYGVFFAFSEAQFEEKQQPGVEYAGLVGGGIIPKDNVKAFYEDFASLQNQQKEYNLKHFSKEKLILDELFNYEAFYTWEIDEAFEVLNEMYGFTKQDVQEVFNKNRDKYSD